MAKCRYCTHAESGDRLAAQLDIGVSVLLAGKDKRSYAHGDVLAETPGPPCLRCLMAVRYSSRLSPVRNSQLGEHAAKVALHSSRRDEEALCHLGVGQVLADNGRDPEL